MKKTAIMQPYFFPYIGYFQMVKAVDSFVFYDDVNFINRGWINRNRILINSEAKYFTIPLIKASQNKLINEIEINNSSPELKKMLKSIELTYKKAPYFDSVFPIIKSILEKEYTNIAEIAQESVIQISKHLELDTNFYVSSQDFPESKGLDRAERLKYICKKLDSTTYINAIGGQELYSKDDFVKENIELQFIKPQPIEYKQFNNEFVPWLSIIDVIMFNSKEAVKELLNKFDLV